MEDSSDMDEIAAKLGLTLEQLARLREIYLGYQGQARPESGQPGFGIPTDITAPDLGSDLPTKWPLMPWDKRTPRLEDKPKPSGAATSAASGLDTGFAGVTPEDLGVIGTVPGFHTPTQLSLGAYLTQEGRLTEDEGYRLDQYLTS